jgi:hypothetical protein
MTKSVGLVFLCALLSGCAAGSGDCDGELASECSSDLAEAVSESRSGQSRSGQGRSAQSRSGQGTEAGSYAVTGARIGGVAVNGLALEGTKVMGYLDGQPISGEGFVGATVIQVSPSGDTMEAKIEAIEIDPLDPTGETWLYTLSVDAGAGGRANMCLPGPDGAARAIPVAGRWTDSGAREDVGFTFGCTSGVIAKCVRWGYRPWESVNGASLASYHQACTRMARADYCGDGTSHTQDGTIVDFYDNLSINTNTADLLMLFDGAWSPDGAYCIGKERWLELSDLAGTLSLAPACQSSFSLTLLTTSPVSGADLCLMKRSDIPRTQVLIDNRAGLNLSL